MLPLKNIKILDLSETESFVSSHLPEKGENNNEIL